MNTMSQQEDYYSSNIVALTLWFTGWRFEGDQFLPGGQFLSEIWRHTKVCISLTKSTYLLVSVMWDDRKI